MVPTKPFLVAAVAGGVGLFVVLAFASSLGPEGSTHAYALLEPGADGDARETTGQEVRLSVLDGEAPTYALVHSQLDRAVLLVKVPTSALLEAAHATGQPTSKWSLPHPSEAGVSVLAYDGHSTLHGCTVSVVPVGEVQQRAGVPFVRIMDACHQGQWNALAMAEPIPGTPAPTPLGVVPIVFGPGHDPLVYAGAVLDQDRSFAAAGFDVHLRIVD